ncbi:DUF1206 domain-containing protein [Flavobacterium sp.]|uniref:DUF1206 domain-containing protein n=1 Tax=Flavobacterium sp. TaxID=239 RepID=UPI0026030413|nr:DUF1206 domain-containing protein [Flavobacterium sp.]
MTTLKATSSKLEIIAKAGFTAKGIVYALLGLLTFMAAFNINGKSTGDTDKNGVFNFLYSQPGGQVLLGLLAVGLVCYCIWRLIQAFTGNSDSSEDKKKEYAKRARYLFSAIAYGGIAFQVVRKLFISASGSGNDSKENLARELLTKPFGQVLTGIAALILLGVGLYQIYYGYSEKYKEHVDKAVNEKSRKGMMTAGKTGYIARGVVWLLLAWLFLKAAWEANASNAGNTSKAFGFLQETSYGPYLLVAIAVGLVCYGTFNFVRARYENFV